MTFPEQKINAEDGGWGKRRLGEVMGVGGLNLFLWLWIMNGIISSNQSSNFKVSRNLEITTPFSKLSIMFVIIEVTTW